MPKRRTKHQKEVISTELGNWGLWLDSRIAPKSKPVKAPKSTRSDLLAVYPMGDPHFGMYAWKDETGTDFDLRIAERLTYRAIDTLVAKAPSAKTAVILELGDFYHADNSNALTQSGHHLDVDTRWSRVMRIGLRAMVYVVEAALRKHDRVIVRIVSGNHDRHSSIALALGLDAWFRAERRVKIDLCPSLFWYFRFGNVLIGATHGDTARPANLPQVMATDRAADWGRTEFRHWYIGHVHHQSVSEYPGALVESFRTLASRDAWHSGAGYRSGRDQKLIIHHRKFGEIERHRCDVSMISR